MSDPLDDRDDYFRKNGVPQRFYVGVAVDFADEDVAASMVTSRDTMRVSTHRPPLGVLKFSAMQETPASLRFVRVYGPEEIRKMMQEPEWSNVGVSAQGEGAKRWNAPPK